MKSQSNVIISERADDSQSHEGNVLHRRPRLHIGCGRSKSEGSIGVDISLDSFADVLVDLDRSPWPFLDESIDEVIAIDVLEHLSSFLSVMGEIHRILVPGGFVKIRVPGASSHHQVTDPTHTRSFTSKSFQYFAKAFQSSAFSYGDICFNVIECQYRFTYNRSWLDDLLLRWVNNNKIRYERRFLYWYQIPELHFLLQKDGGNVARRSLR
jgi:SAM-dependent methyltransferase